MEQRLSRKPFARELPVFCAADVLDDLKPHTDASWGPLMAKSRPCLGALIYVRFAPESGHSYPRNQIPENSLLFPVPSGHFPVPMFREFGAQCRCSHDFAAVLSGKMDPKSKISLYFPCRTGKLPPTDIGDGFARDCAHRQSFVSEPPVPTVIAVKPPFRGTAADIPVSVWVFWVDLRPIPPIRPESLRSLEIWFPCGRFLMAQNTSTNSHVWTAPILGLAAVNGQSMILGSPTIQPLSPA